MHYLSAALEVLVTGILKSPLSIAAPVLYEITKNKNTGECKLFENSIASDALYNCASPTNASLELTQQQTRIFEDIAIINSLSNKSSYEVIGLLLLEAQVTSNLESWIIISGQSIDNHYISATSRLAQESKWGLLVPENFNVIDVDQPQQPHPALSIYFRKICLTSNSTKAT